MQRICCLLFFLVCPLQQMTKTRKLEQCVIYLVLLSGDRRPVVPPASLFVQLLWIIFFSVVKRPVHLSLFWKYTSNFTLAAVLPRSKRNGKHSFSQLSTERGDRRKGCRVRERCLSQWVSARVCDCNSVGRWLCVCVSAYWEGRQNAAI